MAVVSGRTQYLNLDQIEQVCAGVAERLLVGNQHLIAALRGELVAISANGLRSSALGQGLFGPHLPRPGLIALAGPGGVGKTFFAELVARVTYGERFNDHLIGVNAHTYFAGRFPPLPRGALEAGPLAIVALEGAEVLPELPPVAALWADVIRYGRGALPVTGEQGQITQQELAFGHCLVVATANVGREEVAHISFRPSEGAEVDGESATRLIHDRLADRFAGIAGEVLPPERWIVLPPLQREDMRRLVDLQLAALGEMLPIGSPPMEISAVAATQLIDRALDSGSPNKTVTLVELMRATVQPPVDGALLRHAAAVPLRVRIDVEGERLRAVAELVPARVVASP